MIKEVVCDQCKGKGVCNMRYISGFESVHQHIPLVGIVISCLMLISGFYLVGIGMGALTLGHMLLFNVQLAKPD